MEDAVTLIHTQFLQPSDQTPKVPIITLYNQQMNNQSYISYLKNSMMELVKHSTDSGEAKDEGYQKSHQFYQQFTRMRKMKKCTITSVQTMPGKKFNRAYAVYHISVITEDLAFKVTKRYSEFQKLYELCLKQMSFEHSFPEKTIWSAGYQQQITASRQSHLNKILQQLNKEQTPEAARHILFKFIHLHTKYQEQLLSPTTPNIYNEEFLLDAIAKLNNTNTQTLHIFKNIEVSMAERKRKLSYQLSKQMLMGFDHNEGILPFVLSNSNELIVIAGLHLINWLFSPEMNKDFQVFIKVLQKISSAALLLQFYKYFENSEIKVRYFRFVRLYLQIREQLTVSSICGDREEFSELCEDYRKWANWNSRMEC